jgi:hypothetical protein
VLGTFHCDLCASLPGNLRRNILVWFVLYRPASYQLGDKPSDLRWDSDKDYQHSISETDEVPYLSGLVSEIFQDHFSNN